MHCRFILLFVCSFLLGCMTTVPFTDLQGRRDETPGDMHQWTRDFNLDDPVDRRKMLESLDHELMQQEIANTPAGSKVSIVVDFDQQFTGTVVNKNSDGVELMNCICKEAVPGLNGRRQCKTSHVPFQAFKTSAMTHFAVIAAPAADFAPPDLHNNAGVVTVAEIVFKDGHRHQLSQPQDETAR